MKRTAYWIWEWVVYALWVLSQGVEVRLSGAHYRAESRLRREEGRRHVDER